MAGAIAKTLGALLLIVGVVLLVGGLGLAAYGWQAEQDNQDRLLPDGNASDENEAAMMAGGIGAVSGVVLGILGAVLIGAGAGQSQRAFALALKGEPSAASSTNGPKMGQIVGIVAAVVVVAAAVFAATSMAGGESSGYDEAAATGDDPVPDGAAVLFSDHFDGSIAMTAMVNGGSQALVSNDNHFTFETPAKAERVSVSVEWQATEHGAKELDVVLFVGEDEVGRAEGTSPVVLDIPIEWTDAVVLRVYPEGQAGVVMEQSFGADVRAYSIDG